MAAEDFLGSVSFLNSAFWLSAGITAAKALAVVALGAAVIKFGNSLIERLVTSGSKVSGLDFDEARARTLMGLLRSTLRYGAGIVMLLMILELFGIDTKALLGGAAVLGLAVGFGAQNLVRDIITGFFIIYERQYDIGDYVAIAGVSGVVEQIGLRTTVLRDWSGDLHTVPNGLVDKTTNKSRRGSRALLEVPVPYTEDLRQVMSLLQEVCDKTAADMPVITEGPRPLGVNKLGDRGASILVWARTEPLSQWGVERELLLRFKEAFDKAGIRIPYPRVVISGADEEIAGKGHVKD